MRAAIAAGREHERSKQSEDEQSREPHTLITVSYTHLFQSAVVHTASIPIGGQHFTNDLAAVLRLPVALAEELKQLYGNAVVTNVPQNERCV